MAEADTIKGMDRIVAEVVVVAEEEAAEAAVNDFQAIALPPTTMSSL
jgi:hypothetical protein